MKWISNVVADKFLLFLDWMSPFDRVVCGEYNGTYSFYSFLLVYSISISGRYLN